MWFAGLATFVVEKMAGVFLGITSSLAEIFVRPVCRNLAAENERRQDE
jgi:hypothetical protein